MSYFILIIESVNRRYALEVGERIYLTNNKDETLVMKEQDLYDLLDKYFKENFT